jgi:ABC-type uncharacterized transport system involved in gliding motility auxiliary subunit
MLPYPFWVRVVRSAEEARHPVSSSIESMVMPWVSPVVVADNATSALKVDVLAQSSDSAWVQQDYFDLNPEQDFNARSHQTGRRSLAVALSGSFTSYFAGRDVPPPKDAKPAQPSAAVIERSPETRIIVAGTSRCITENFPEEFEGNRTFFLNAVDWLTIGDELIGIRSRAAGERPLQVLSEPAKLIVRAVNLLAVPLLVIVFGLLHYGLRRRRRQREAQAMTGDA